MRQEKMFTMIFLLAALLPPLVACVAFRMGGAEAAALASAYLPPLCGLAVLLNCWKIERESYPSCSFWKTKSFRFGLAAWFAGIAACLAVSSMPNAVIVIFGFAAGFVARDAFTETAVKSEA